MSRLKAENLTKCFSLLREFIDDASELNHKKGIAIMALNQLQKITAGNIKAASADMTCLTKPRADGTPDSNNG